MPTAPEDEPTTAAAQHRRRGAVGSAPHGDRRGHEHGQHQQAAEPLDGHRHGRGEEHEERERHEPGPRSERRRAGRIERRGTQRPVK